MPSVVLLQSFRRHDVPRWVVQCQRSVYQYAQGQGWDYAFMGDEFFDLAAPWVKARLQANDPSTLSDVCRLTWMQRALERYEHAVWADIDLVIFAGNRIGLDLTMPHGFAYEAYADESGVHDGVNNAFMFFHRDSPMLASYLSLCHDVLRQAGDHGTVERMALGPSLLRGMAIPQSHVIRGLDIFNIATLYEMYQDPGRMIPVHTDRGPQGAVGGANLCLNQRALYPVEQRSSYDEVVARVVEALLGRA